MKIRLFFLAGLIAIIFLTPFFINSLFHNYKAKPLSGNSTNALINVPDSSVKITKSECEVLLATKILSSLEDDVFEYPDFVKLCCILAKTQIEKDYFSSTVPSTKLDDILKDCTLDDANVTKKWGQSYDLRVNTIRDIINDKSLPVITYNGNIISAYYHLVSSGYTRIPKEALDFAYLKCVPCESDKELSDYLQSFKYRQDDLTNYLSKYFSANIIDFSKELYITSIDTGGYVETIRIGNREVSGEEFCAALSLPSEAFSIIFQEDNVKIITKGVGHGYGLSLSYAFSLIKSGNTIENTLSYFYDNILLISE